MAPGQDCMGLIPDAYLQASSKSSLSELTIALGLLSHPQTRNDEEMIQLATKKYAYAVTATKEAIGDPTRSAKDETLMTVILLAAYEVVTGIAPAALDSWTAHINGSMDLLKLRGTEQFKSRAGLAMFIHTRTRIFVSCGQRCVAIPEELMQLSRASYPYLNEEEAALTNLGEAIAEFCQLRANIADGITEDLAQIGAKLVELDNAHLEWYKKLPEKFHATRVPVVKSDLTYENYYDVYCNRFIAGVMHSYATSRLVINQHMKRVMERELKQGDSTQYIKVSMQAIEDAILETSLQICAGVPFVMGFKAPELGQEGKLNLYGSSNLAWILFPVIVYKSNPQRMRDWCYNQLIHLAELSGIRQVKTIAELAKAGIDLSDVMTSPQEATGMGS